MSALELVTFTVTGPKLGEHVFFVVDGGVREGEVAGLSAAIERDDDLAEVEPRIRVAWFNVDGAPQEAALSPLEVFATAAEACDAAFGAQA